MATIAEDFVSFETAKLLKEKGFDEYCPKSYFKMDKTLKESGFSEWEKVNEIKAPTQSLAMKWLREVHNLWCEISPEGKGLWYMEVYSLTDEEYIPNSNGHKIKSYEEACESAIKYCLEHLI